MTITCACLNNSVGVEVASIYEAERLRAEAVTAGLPVPPFVQRLGLHFVVLHPERAKADMRDLLDALIENVERCKACGGYGVVNRPSCDNGDCTDPDCIPVEVYCVDCGGYDLLPVA